jgi:hypothetical protein
MAAPKGKKIVPVVDNKGKKAMDSLTIEYTLKPPMPGYPKEKERQVILEENLKRMGCEELWNFPWRYFDKQMLNKMVAWQSTLFLDSIRGRPEK